MWTRRILERLQAIQNKQGSTMGDELRQSFALFPRRSETRIWICKPSESRITVEFRGRCRRGILRTDTFRNPAISPELRSVKKDICKQSRKRGFASKVAKLWQVIHFVGHFWRRIIACKSVPRLDLHPAGLEPATLEVTELIHNRLGQRRSCERSSRRAESKIGPLRLAYGFRPARVAILRCTVVTPPG